MRRDVLDMGDSELYRRAVEELGNMLLELKRHTHLCIYGAGNRAKELLQMRRAGFLDLPAPEYYLVSDMGGTREYNSNPEEIDGIPVYLLCEKAGDAMAGETAVFVVSLEHYHGDIGNRLRQTPYKDIYYLTDAMERILMADYMRHCFSMYGFDFAMTDMHEADVYCGGHEVQNRSIMTYMVQCDADVGLEETRKDRDWVTPLQSGAALSEHRLTNVTDADGDNISAQNPYYNEMTGLYWVWKNTKWDYSGICHYRRQFESDIVLKCLYDGEADVILPMPTSVYPNMRGYYGNWGEDGYYEAMLAAIRNLKPDYYETALWCAEHEIFIPNNICIAKREILDDYCRFAFEIIDETERRMDGCPGKRQKRCWESEHVSTIYFMKHNHDYRIVFSNLKRYW